MAVLVAYQKLDVSRNLYELSNNTQSILIFVPSNALLVISGPSFKVKLQFHVAGYAGLPKVIEVSGPVDYERVLALHWSDLLLASKNSTTLGSCSMWQAFRASEDASWAATPKLHAESKI